MSDFNVEAYIKGLEVDLVCERFAGYSRQELGELFDFVCDPKDWRAPIDTVINSAAVQDVEVAVMFFTGTPVSVTPDSSPGMVRVRADGYRNGPFRHVESSPRRPK